MTVELWNKIHELEEENRKLKETRDFSVKEGLRLIDENFQLGVELSALKLQIDKVKKWAYDALVDQYVEDKIREIFGDSK